jgi:y4mF family transcriptional regulator
MIERAFLVPEIVRARRKRLGLRQEELAELSGCSTRFVHAVEAGKESLRLDKLLDLLAALGLGLTVRRGPAGIRVEADASASPDESP